MLTNKRIKNTAARFIIVMFLCVGVVLSGCKKEAEPRAPRRTFMIYMNGSDLEADYGAGSADINEMLNAEIRSDCKIYIYTGGCKKWHNENISADENALFVIENGSLVKKASYPPADMGSASVLRDFVTGCIGDEPLGEYHLILWNHGGSAITGFGKDDNHGGDSLMISELEAAFKDIYERSKIKLTSVAFDACLSGSLENFCAISDYCSYMVAAEDIMPLEGFDYRSFFTEEKNALGETASAPKLLAETYYNSQKRNRAGLVTVSVLDCKGAAELKKAFEDAALLLKEREMKKRHMLTVFGGATSYEGYANMADIISLFEAYALNNTEEFIALADRLAETVISCFNSPYRSSCCGLSVYYPAYIGDASTYEASLYSKLGFSETYSDIVKAKAAEGLLGYEKAESESLAFEIDGVIYDALRIDENLTDIFYSAVFEQSDSRTMTYRIKKSRFSEDTEITAVYVSCKSRGVKSSEKYILK